MIFCSIGMITEFVLCACFIGVYARYVFRNLTEKEVKAIATPRIKPGLVHFSDMNYWQQ